MHLGQYRNILIKFFIQSMFSLWICFQGSGAGEGDFIYDSGFKRRTRTQFRGAGIYFIFRILSGHQSVIERLFLANRAINISFFKPMRMKNEAKVYKNGLVEFYLTPPRVTRPRFCTPQSYFSIYGVPKMALRMDLDRPIRQ